MIARGFTVFTPMEKAFTQEMTSGIGNVPIYPIISEFAMLPAIMPERNLASYSLPKYVVTCLKEYDCEQLKNAMSFKSSAAFSVPFINAGLVENIIS